MTSTKLATPETKPTIKRLLGVIRGAHPGPTLIFVGGIHGNEPSGVNALREAMSFLQGKEHLLHGTIFALAGNLPALEKGVRYIDQDLNRMFTKERIGKLGTPSTADCSETKQKRELLQQLNTIIETEKGPFYFFDLHTTSGNTIPFLTVNDSLLNRTYTQQYPVPNVLGIEEFLEGPLLSYINELGYIAFGFEAGQHASPLSTKNHYAFIMLSLAFTGSMRKEDVAFNRQYAFLQNAAQSNHRFYEIIYRHQINPKNPFKMEPGFENFECVTPKKLLARAGEKNIYTPKKGRIFMPLYQGKGEDGFFIIRTIPKIFLWISKWVRNAQLDHLLVILPGVSWGDAKKETLLVNRTIARFLAKDIFHLLGYRSKRLGTSHLIMKNRERTSRKSEYE